MKSNKENFTLKGMRFEVIFNTNCEKEEDGYFYITDDQSLMYKKEGGDFSVLLSGNWRLELLIDSSTGKCIKYQSLLDEFKYEESKLSFPKSKRAELYFSCDEKLMPASGCHYLPFENKVFYDKDKEIMCIGSKENIGQAIEFAKGTIAIIEKEQLKALYLKLPVTLKN